MLLVLTKVLTDSTFSIPRSVFIPLFIELLWESDEDSFIFFSFDSSMQNCLMNAALGGQAKVVMGKIWGIGLEVKN